MPKYLTNIDLVKNQLQNAVIHILGTDPASPTEGQIYYNSTLGDKKLYLHDGTSFKAIGDITGVASSSSQLTVTGGGAGEVSLSLSLAASITNGEAGLVTGDLIFNYISGGAALVNSVAAGTGISVSGSTGAVTITNTDLGSSQSIFKNIVVSGQSTVVAETNNDSLTLVAGSNMTITTDATTNTITLSSAGATYVAGSGLTLTGNSFGHTNIITASNFGDTGLTRTLAFGGTFVVPYVTYDDYGHISTKSDLTLTLPANVDTNWYPTTFAWTAGTAAGPTGSLTGVGMSAVSYGAIPAASGTNSGIVTNGTQTFAGAKTFSNNVTITGNLTVNGTATTINTETINLADNLIILNSNYTGSTPTENGGIEVERGTLANSSLIWNETTDKWQVSADSTTFYDIVTSAQSFSASIGDGVLTTIPVTHNLGTRDVIVQLFDMSSYDTVFADVIRTDANTVTVLFTVAPTTNGIRVLITKIGSSIT